MPPYNVVNVKNEGRNLHESYNERAKARGDLSFDRTPLVRQVRHVRAQSVLPKMK